MGSKIVGARVGPPGPTPIIWTTFRTFSISVFRRTSLTCTCACLYTTAVYAVQTTVNFHKERGSFHVQIGNNKKSCTGFQGGNQSKQGGNRALLSFVPWLRLICCLKSFLHWFYVTNLVIKTTLRCYDRLTFWGLLFYRPWIDADSIEGRRTTPQNWNCSSEVQCIGNGWVISVECVIVMTT